MTFMNNSINIPVEGKLCLLAAVLLIVALMWPDKPQPVQPTPAPSTFNLQLTEVEGHKYLVGHHVGVVHAESCTCKLLLRTFNMHQVYTNYLTNNMPLNIPKSTGPEIP